MGRGHPIKILLLGLSSLLAATRAHAADCSSIAASTCINADTLWLRATPSTFITIAGTEPIASGELSTGLALSYLRSPVRLISPSPGPSGTEIEAVRDQVTTTVFIGYGITRTLSLDLAMPVSVYQAGAGLSSVSGGPSLASAAMRDMQAGLSWAVLARRHVSPWEAEAFPDRILPSRWGLVLRMDASIPTADPRQFGGEGAVVFAPSAAVDLSVGRFVFGAELGARLRPTREVLGTRIGSQLVTALGVGLHILPRDRLSATVEARFLPTFAEQHDVNQGPNGVFSTANGKRIWPAEWLASVRSAPLLGGDLSFHWGVGAGIPLGDGLPVTVPTFRTLLSIRYAPLKRDSDGDGVLDRVDRCPFKRVPWVSGTDVPMDGCEHAPTVVDFSQPK